MQSLKSRLSYLLLVASAASAQSILPQTSSSAFPSCALTCAALLQAQTQCTPPTAAVSTQLTYENCFCQNPALAGIYSSPDAVCTAECTVESDRALLRTWFTIFCQEVGQGIDPNAATSATSTTMVTITSTRSSSPTDATVTGSGSSSSAAPSTGKSWIDTHWKWILMLGILVVGLIGLTVLAVWLKRRHRRRLEEKRAAASGFPTPSEKRRDGARSATPDLWGPHQHMHATKGWQYDQDPDVIMGSGALAGDEKRRHRRSKRDSTRKGKGRADAEISEISARPSASRHQSSRSRHRNTNEIAEMGGSSRATVEERSRSRRRRDRETERRQDREVEKGLRGLKDKETGRNKENEKM